MAFSGTSSGSNFIDAGTFVNGADYAVYDAGGYMRAMVAGSNACDYAYDPADSAGMTSRHVLLDTAYVAQPSVAVLTLSLSGGSTGFGLAGSATLTLSDGGILKTGGGTATISGGAGLSATGEYVLRADTASDQLVIATPLSGGTGLTKSGLGTVVLAASGNSYGGATTIDAGTLQVGNGGSGGRLGPGPLVTSDGSLLSFDLSASCAVSAAISGQGGLLQFGTGTLVLSGSNSYSGGTTVSGGTLQIVNPASLPDGSLSVGNGAALLFGGDLSDILFRWRRPEPC